MDYRSIDDLPILDSFIKESVRLNPLDLSKFPFCHDRTDGRSLTKKPVAIRRKALNPFRFPDGGPQLQPGQVACVSSYDIMHDPVKYPRPHEFDGFRFLSSSDGKPSGVEEQPLRGTKFVDGSKDFPIWGFGSKIW